MESCGFGQKFPICDGLLDSMKNTFGLSTQHWAGMLLEKSGAVGELEKNKNGRAFLQLILNHHSLEQKIYKLLQEMRDEEKMKKETVEDWNEDLNDELAERKSNQQYDVVAKSPNRVIHALVDDRVLMDESIGMGTGTTVCGEKFVTDGTWELYEDYFFCEEKSACCITCKKCRKMEIERIKRGILKVKRNFL